MMKDLETVRDWRSVCNERLAEVLAIHFDPDWGSPFWIERARRLGFDPRREIGCVDDLPRMGVLHPEELSRRPVEDLIPRSVVERKEELVVAQTGGTLGDPVWTAYQPDEFSEAFVAPFLAAAGRAGFPTGGSWLYVGPSGPHIIGRAADAIAQRTGSPTPFFVDFDPRWARKLPSGSFGARRYLEHVIDQAMQVLRDQNVTVLFTTPTVLGRLADRMTTTQRAAICGVHYGGVALSVDLLRRFQCDLFPNAVHLSGYGNTLFGCCLELSVEVGRALRYFPYGARIVFGIVSGSEGSGSEESGSEEGGDRVCYSPPPGAGCGRGRLAFTRLDRTMLLINVIERDEVGLVAPPEGSPDGFLSYGVESPAPVCDAGPRVLNSLY